MAFTKNLLEDEKISSKGEKRILPNLEVGNYDRLHFHISNGSYALKDLNIRVLFGTRVGSKVLLADSTVWFEDGVSEREFSFQTPSDYNGTGLVMSVPVVAPILYDVILKNTGGDDLDTIYVSVLAQEI